MYKKIHYLKKYILIRKEKMKHGYGMSVSLRILFWNQLFLNWAEFM